LIDSPGDVLSERKLLSDMVENWNADRRGTDELTPCALTWKMRDLPFTSPLGRFGGRSRDVIPIPLAVSPTAVESCRHRYPVAVLAAVRSRNRSVQDPASNCQPWRAWSFAKPIETTTMAYTQAIFLIPSSPAQHR